MARFRGMVQGNRGQASRLGHAKGGLQATVNGWDIGVNVYARENSDNGQDLIEIYLSGGSNGSEIRAIGFVSLKDGVPSFRLAPSYVSACERCTAASEVSR